MNILLIDDSDLYARMVQRVATQDGHGTTVASSGEEAMAILRREGVHASRPPIGLIICDLHMGTHSGLDTLRLIKADDAVALVPVLLMSVDDSKRQVRLGYQLGAASWITKTSVDQAAQLSEILAYWAQIERIEV